MSRAGTYILGLRHGRQWATLQVADLTGISVGRQQKIEEGLCPPTPQERRAYATAFGFPSPADFDQGWRSRAVRLSSGNSEGRIPVINLVPAGEPGDYGEVYPDSGIGYAYIDPPPGVCGSNLFAFVIAGDSMEPDFPSGHFAICRPTLAEDVRDADPAFVRFGAAHGHGCTFKRCFRVDRLRLELRAINPAYWPRVVVKADVDRLAPVIACVAPTRSSSSDRSEVRYATEDSQAAANTYGEQRRNG